MTPLPRITHIYSISDPFSRGVVYVGKSNNPQYRLRQHRLAASTGRALTGWLRDLEARGAEPILIILETVDPDAWRERERFWVEHFRSSGARLFNITDGGNGCGTSPNFRRRLSEFTRRRISIGNTGKKRSPAAIARLALARKGNNGLRGHHPSDETRRKMSAALLGNNRNAGHTLPAGQRLKMAEARRHWWLSNKEKAGSLRTVTVARNRLGQSSEARTKIAHAAKGRKFADSTRRKFQQRAQSDNRRPDGTFSGTYGAMG